MTATYIHTKKEKGKMLLFLRFLAVLYVAGIIASIAYLWTCTQDRYVSYAAFKISRQDGSSIDSGLVQLALPGLSDSGTMDSMVVIGYIASADLLLEIEKEFDLVKHYSAPVRDRVFRLEANATLEDRLEFYRKRIFAHFDKDTGLTMLTVDTFDPRLTHDMAKSVLDKADAYINRLNHEIADQQLSFVTAEVERTGKIVDGLNREMIELQNRHRLITPEEVISASLTALKELQMEELRTEAALTSIQRDSPESPKIEPLRSELRSLRELIDIETAKLSGPERDRLNQILIEFKELQLKLDFAIRLRSGAETMLEKNRMEAVSLSRFFSVIQQPFMPEEQALPRRWYATATILIVGFLIFLVFRALTHSVFESA
jgi:capsular polysaccharide transport system permease protein